MNQYKARNNDNNFKRYNNNNWFNNKNKDDGDNNNGYKNRPRDNDNYRPRDNNNYRKDNDNYRPRDNDRYRPRDNNDDNPEEIETSHAVKQQLVKFIYDSINISKFKYKLMEYEYDLPMLKDYNYFVSPNYNGINGLLIFIKIKDSYYSFIIDRRTLSYNAQQVDIEKIKSYPVKIKLDKSIYNGTIIDGVLLYNKGRIKQFMINDVYLFRGQDLSEDKMNNKLLNISSYFDSVMNTNTNDTILHINKLYDMSELKKLINSYIPNNKLNNSIKGIAFYPDVSGTKLIYLYNNCSQMKDDTPTNHPSTVNPVIVKQPVRNFAVKDANITAIFRAKKTDIVDVYNLYLTEVIKDKGKAFIKYKKWALAYIPSRECSFFCKDLFANQDTALVECKYILEKDKWMPFKHITDRKKPDSLISVRDKIDKLKQEK
jgi:hypothetical protein